MTEIVDIIAAIARLVMIQVGMLVIASLAWSGPLYEPIIWWRIMEIVLIAVAIAWLWVEALGWFSKEGST